MNCMIFAKNLLFTKNHHNHEQCEFLDISISEKYSQNLSCLWFPFFVIWNDHLKNNKSEYSEHLTYEWRIGFENMPSC